MPFANVHHAAFQYQCERSDIGLKALNNRIVEANGRANTFFSVIVRGTFSFIKTRAVIKQQAPYPTLVEVADRQAMFLRHDVRGTLLGYFSPVMFHGAAVAGFHEHFLSDDRTFGGHVLDAVLDHGKIHSQVFDTLMQHLPVDDPGSRFQQGSDRRGHHHRRRRHPLKGRRAPRGNAYDDGPLPTGARWIDAPASYDSAESHARRPSR